MTDAKREVALRKNREAKKLLLSGKCPGVIIETKAPYGDPPLTRTQKLAALGKKVVVWRKSEKLRA